MIEPYADNLVVALREYENKTSSGLILAAAKTEEVAKAEVISVGKGRTDNGVLCPPDVRAGDIVYFSKEEIEEIPGEDEVFLSEKKVVLIQRGDEIIPTWDKVLIELKDEEVTTSTGLIISSGQEKGYDEGTVLHVGPGYLKAGERLPMELAPGDNVYFSRFMGIEVELGLDDVRRLYLTREYDVYGVLQK